MDYLFYNCQAVKFLASTAGIVTHLFISNLEKREEEGEGRVPLLCQKNRG